MPMPPLVGVDSPLSLGTQISAVSLATPASATFPSANRAILVPFVVTEDCTVVKLWAYNGAAVSGNIDLGIYDEPVVPTPSRGSFDVAEAFGELNLPLLKDQPMATLQAASACQSTGVGIGRHCQIKTARTTLESSTYRLRSISFGTTRVQTRLNPGRAITECCKPNSSIRSS